MPVSTAFSLENSSASLLLTAVFKWFDEANIPYCVQRNYHGYPDRLTGDVDIVVPEGQIAFIADKLRRLAHRLGWSCYIEYSWRGSAHLGFCKSIYPERFVLVIELFAGGSWRGMVYLSSSNILSGRIRHGITWRPRPAHQAVITAIHHLLYNQEVPDKYKEEICSLVRDDQELFKQVLSSAFGKSLSKLTLETILDGGWEMLANKAAWYKFFLALLIYKHPFISLVNILHGFRACRHIPEGVLFVVCNESEKQRNLLCKMLLEIAEQWHIFIPIFRKIINCDNPVRLGSSEAKLVYHVVRHGGIAVINCKVALDINLKLSYPFYRITSVEDGSRVDVEHNNCIKDSKTLVISDGDVEQMVLQIWNFILIDRSQRNLTFND